MAYLNLAAEGSWPGLEVGGLVVDAQGALQLAPLAEPTEAVSGVIAPVEGLRGPVGIAVDGEGNIFASDPGGHRILRLDGCGGEAQPLPCVRGPGDRPGQVHSPRGLTIDTRGRLWVADAGNGRIQAWDLASGQVVGIWGGSWHSPVGHALRLHEPWDLAADADDNIYVADPGELLASGARREGRVLRLSPHGEVDAAFLHRMSASEEVPRSPTSVAVALAAPDGSRGERLLVLDQGPERLLAYFLDGSFDPVATETWARAAGAPSGSNALSFLDDRLYVGTPASGTLAFDRAGELLGRVGPAGSAAAGIAIDCAGRLLIHPGNGGSIMRAEGAPSFNSCGTFFAGPFGAAGVSTHWQRIRMDLDLPPGAHIRLYTLTSEALSGETAQTTPDMLSCSVGDPVVELANGDRWIAAPLDAQDFYIQNEPSDFLWISGQLRGGRRTTARLRQLRVDHDRDGWISWMPAMYRRDPRTRATVDRFLALFETVHADAQQQIEDLPVLFDPRAAPDDPGGAGWLDWLSTWVGMRLGETWTGEQRRRAVERAFRMHARRGTVGYLREMIWLHSGVRARVYEGAASSDVWVLGQSRLGAETRPAAFPAQGAVLGTTATVDHSYMRGDGRYGAELFDDSVHCLFVHVYRGELRDPDVLDRITRVLDDEVPAHMVYRLCVIEPAMRVGHQARVGVDAITAGPPRPRIAEEGQALGSTFVLPQPRGARRDRAMTPEVGARIS